MSSLVTKFTIVSLFWLFIHVRHLYGTSTVSRQVYEPRDSTGTTVQGDCNNSPVGIGRCIKITNCHPLLESNYNRLRDFGCGYERFKPMVCCPIYNRQPSPRLRRTPMSRPRPTPTPIPRSRPRPTPTPTPRSRPRPTPTARPKPTPTPTSRHRRRPTPTTPPRPRPQEDNRPGFLPLECGRSNVVVRRIVGGHESEPGAWPWIVALYIRERGINRFICGGALVTPDTVVTAAHCVTSDDGRLLEANVFTARLGEHDQKNDNDEAVDIPVTSVKRHENFHLPTYKNDIAILKLSRKVSFTSRIQPVCLPYDSLKTEDLVEKKAFVAGWGTIAYKGPLSNVLREIEIPVWKEEKCRTVYRNDVPITQEYLCAGTDDGKKDSCQGDSGGPLMMVGPESRYYLMGVVSFGKRCGTPGFPGVYANVRVFLPWIRRHAV